MSPTSKKNALRLATRGSALAIWQANRVADLLRAKSPELHVELVKVVTSGDRIRTRALRHVGDKGLFVKEIEEAILSGKAHAGVHSLKDLPSQLPPQLNVVSIPEREDPRDALLSHNKRTLPSMPLGAVVGTSSLRRQGQLLRLRPDLQVIPVRGNVDTRVRKLRDRQLSGLLMAYAGLKRLELEYEISEILSIDEMVPAPGQGALAIEAPVDSPYLEILQSINHELCFQSVMAEREFSIAINADCRTPVACYCDIRDGSARLDAIVCSPDGRHYLRTVKVGEAANSLHVARVAAADLLDQGAGPILDAAREL